MVKENKCLNETQRQRGQAMVEFVFMLFLFMILISGMLYFFRLLMFDFWAQQEARLLAFEQTWSPVSTYADPLNEPVSNVENGGANMRRPGLVTGLGKTRAITKDGSLSDLLLSKLAPSRLFPRRTFSNVDDPSLFTETAYASIEEDARSGSKLERISPRVREVKGVPGIERGIVGILEQIGFGPRFCEVGTGVLTKYHYRVNATPFADPNCGEYFNAQFGAHLAQTTNFPDRYREFGERIGDGVTPGEALEQVVDSAVATGFYSFFDTAVKTAFLGAVPYISAKRFDYMTADADQSIFRMLSEMRYLGSSAAILLIRAKFGEMVFRDPSNRDVTSEKIFEDSVTDLLHVDASDVLPIIGDGFFLNPTYLPIPPTFGTGAGGLLEGGMATALSDEEDKQGDLIDNSGRKVEVHYDSTGGLFPAATRRFATAGRIMDAKFYILTQDWHIWRQNESTYEYLEKGDQFDAISDLTEEGVLRRRVLGFWLFPSLERADLLFKPITDLVPIPGLDAVMSVVNGLGEVIGVVKSFLVDNPFLDILDGLNSIPIVGSLVPSFPKWPVVRPDAYPKSEEIEGDKLAGPDMSREFKDFVDEQRTYNPEPEPDFN